MREFELEEPRSVADALDVLQAHGLKARPLGGGTDLVAGVMRDQLIGKGMPYPSHLVDLTTVAGLAEVQIGPAGAVIGAATKLVDIAESAELRHGWPMLGQCAENVASAEIRAIGTLGGNIHQRPRCWFFRSKDFNCVKKGGDICFAVHGDNRYNAILGGQLCYIVHPSDMAMTLLALNAQACVASPEGERMVPFDEYFIGPQDDVLRETVLRPDELLTAVSIPPAVPNSYQAWEKLNEKGQPTFDFAVVSVAVAVTAIDGIWQSGRIVLGGVAPVPYRATEVEDALVGQDIRDALPQAATEIRKAARPMRDNAYKLDLAEVLIERVVLTALGRDPAAAPSPDGGSFTANHVGAA